MREFLVVAAVLAAVLTVRHVGKPRPAESQAGTNAPYGMISYFASDECPFGWRPVEAAKGRAIVGAASVSANGTIVGTPMDGVESTHTHTAAATTIALPARAIDAVDGSVVTGAAAGVQPLAFTIAPATSNSPYIQYTACVVRF